MGKSKKKVLHLLSSNKYSGAENVVCTIIDKLKDEFDMVYCSPIGDIEGVLKNKNINYYPLKKLSYGELKKAIKDIKPNIIHAHDNKASVLASLFGKKYKVISHIHGNNKIMNTSNLKTRLFNFCSRKFNHIIWVSDSSLDNYYYYKNVVDKSTVLYNVINSEEIIKKSQEFISDKFDLIFLGRLGYPKDPARFINIIKDVVSKKSDVKVAIVGDGPDRSLIEDLIKNYSLENNIKLFGFQSNPYPILANSKILIMTSIYEGTPMCALEAQALGKPIIATPVDGLKKIVKNDINGYLSTSNDDLVNKIISIIKSKKKYELMSANSVEWFNKNNNLLSYMNKINKIYD